MLNSTDLNKDKKVRYEFTEEQRWNTNKPSSMPFFIMIFFCIENDIKPNNGSNH